MELVIEHLKKKFGEKEVLKDVSFTFEKGKIYGLLGRNGAGKTTLFNCLNEDILKDDSFIKFKNQFNSKTPIKDIYGLYLKTQPKPKVENPGSMKNQPTPNDVKDYYTPEEASKFTRKDFAKNPKLLEAIERSMTKWV